MVTKTAIQALLTYRLDFSLRPTILRRVRLYSIAYPPILAYFLEFTLHFKETKFEHVLFVRLFMACYSSVLTIYFKMPQSLRSLVD